jgi:hypothetical protein
MPAPILTPSSASLRGKAVQHFTSNLSATWEATAGSLFTDAAATLPYVPGVSRSDIYLKAQNVTGSYAVTATNGGAPTGAVVAVTGEMPRLWEFRRPVTVKKRVRVFDPKDGPRQSRTDQGKKETWELGNDGGFWDDYLEVEAFWDAHYPGRTFVLGDTTLEREITCYFDSDLKREAGSDVAVAWSVVVKEA